MSRMTENIEIIESQIVIILSIKKTKVIPSTIYSSLTQPQRWRYFPAEAGELLFLKWNFKFTEGGFREDFFEKMLAIYMLD